MKNTTGIVFSYIISLLLGILNFSNLAQADSCQATVAGVENRVQNPQAHSTSEILNDEPLSTVNTFAPQYRSAASTIPARSSSETPKNIRYFYLVEKGDSLYTITRKTNTAIETLIRINRIPIPYIIYPGQKIYLQ